MFGALLSILELSLLVFVLFECHSFGFLPFFSMCRDHFVSSRKFIININCMSSSAEKHFRVCWEMRTVKDGLAFLKHPWSASCPFDAFLFYPHQVRFCCLAFCVFPGICPRLCPWCWPHLDPLTQALSSSSTSVYSPPSTTLRVHLQWCVLHEASSCLSLLVLQLLLKLAVWQL